MTAKIQGGAILLARQAFERWLWTLTGNQIKVFLWLLFRARWKHGREPWFDGQQIVQIERGQLVTSADALAKANSVSRGCIRKALALFEKTGTIRADTRAKRYTIVSIINYELYQDPRNYQGLDESQPRAQTGPRRGLDGATEENQGIRGIKESGKKNPPTPRKRGNDPAVSPEGIAEAGAYENLSGSKANEPAIRAASKLIAAGKGDDLQKARERYARELNAKDTPREFRIKPHNWFGRASRWAEYTGPEPRIGALADKGAYREPPNARPQMTPEEERKTERYKTRRIELQQEIASKNPGMPKIEILDRVSAQLRIEGITA